MHFTFYTGTAEALHKTFYFLRLGRITPPPQLTFTAYNESGYLCREKDK